MRYPRTTLRFLLVLALASTLSSTVMVALDAVQVPIIGTMLRGEVRRITVTGTIDRSGVIEVTLDYPAQVVRIRSVEGGLGYAFECPVAVMNNEGIVGNTGSISVRCDSADATPSGDLFVLVVEALHGTGGSGLVVPTRFRLDYVDIPSAQLSGGTVSVIGDPNVVAAAVEGFTGNYPNPFSTSSRFVFTMRSAGSVSLSVRSLQGRAVLDLGQIDVTAGENEYELLIDANDLAQGAYLMQLVTESDVHFHPFVVLD